MALFAETLPLENFLPRKILNFLQHSRKGKKDREQIELSVVFVREQFWIHFEQIILFFKQTN